MTKKILVGLETLITLFLFIVTIIIDAVAFLINKIRALSVPLSQVFGLLLLTLSISLVIKFLLFINPFSGPEVRARLYILLLFVIPAFLGAFMLFIGGYRNEFHK